MEALVNEVEQLFGNRSPALVATLSQLGRFYLLTGRVKDATQIMERIKSLVGENPPEQAPGFLNLVFMQEQRSRNRRSRSISHSRARFRAR